MSPFHCTAVTTDHLSPSSPSMTEPYTPTRRPSTPSRIPAPSASPSSSTKKRSLSSIFRSKSSRDVTPQTSPLPGPNQTHKTKASPSLPAIGRAFPLPSPSPGQSREDYFAKTPTKSSKPLPPVTEQQVNPSRVPVTVPSPTHRRDVTTSTVLSSTTTAHTRYSSAATAYSEPEVANVTAKHFISERDNHEQLRKLASRMSSPDNTDASSVRTFGSRTKAPSPPELGEVFLSKPGPATLQVDMEDAIAVHIGSSTEAEDVLGRVSKPEREESLRRALGTSPSTWDVDGLSHTSRTTSPAPSSSSPRRSIPASPVVSRETAGKSSTSKLPVKATVPPPSQAEAAAQKAVESAIYSTPLEVSSVDTDAEGSVTPVKSAQLGSLVSPSEDNLPQSATGHVQDQPASSEPDSTETVDRTDSTASIAAGSDGDAENDVIDAKSTLVADGVSKQEEVAGSNSGDLKQGHLDSSTAIVANVQRPEPQDDDRIHKISEPSPTSDAPSTPVRKLSFTGPFASDPSTSTGSFKVSLPPLHNSSRFAPAPYNDIVPRVLRPKMAVEIDFSNGWIPAIRGGWVGAPDEQSESRQRVVSEQSSDKAESLPRQRVTSWVGSVPVVGRVAGYAGW